MSLKLLLDEDSQAQLLVKLLMAAGHDILTINKVNMAGSSDEVVLDYARQINRILLTHNCNDFESLHQINPKHSGIIAVYRSSNPSKNMNFKGIVRAIANLEASKLTIANQFFVLNQWSY